MADSGQQPTGGSEVDKLVNDIFDMMSDMKIRKIDIGSERLYFNKLLLDEPSLPPEVSAESMGKFMSWLQKTGQDDSNAAAADKPDSSAPTAAIGHTHGEVEGEQPGGVYSGASADARVYTVRGDEGKMCCYLRFWTSLHQGATCSRGGHTASSYISLSLQGVC